MAELIDETGTPSKCGLKRGQPESPDGLSTNIKQTERQIRARQGSDNTLHNISVFQPQYQKREDDINTVVKLSSVAISTINKKIISMFSKRV